MPQTFETRLVFNIKGKARRVKKDGVTYLVVNGVLLKEGVHTGTDGPIYYSKEFLKKIAAKWLKQPIVKDHPVDDGGTPITANTGSFLEDSGMGFLEEPKGEPDLVAELWFDEERAKKVHKKTHNALVEGKPIEVSTGLELEFDETPGEWKGEKYVASALDGTPDHLAIVTNGKGACDNKKGCGCNVTANCSCGTAQNADVTANAMSYNKVAAVLSEKLYKDYGYNYYVRDVYPDFFVYRDGNGKLFKRGYTANKDGEVEVNGEPVEVKYVQEYRTASGGKFVGNASRENDMAAVDKKKGFIDTIIANSEGDWVEDDREHLVKKTDEWLEKKAKGYEKPAQTQNDKKGESDITKPADETKVTKPPVKMTANEWRENLPPEEAEILAEALAAREQERDGLVKKITANKNNTFKDEYLKKQKLEVLRAMAKLSGGDARDEDEVDYSGRATVLTVNRGDDEPAETPLESKGFDWANYKKAK